MRLAFRALIEATRQPKQPPAPGPDINWPIAGGAAAAGLLSNATMHAREAKRGAHLLRTGKKMSRTLVKDIRGEMIKDTKYARNLKLGALGVGAGTLGLYLYDKYGHKRNG